MIDMHSKYDNMHKKGIFYALICINSHIIMFINFMLSLSFALSSPTIRITKPFSQSVTAPAIARKCFPKVIGALL